MQFLGLLLGFTAGLVGVYGMIPLNKTECVEWHNYYRNIHQAPNVAWSNSVEAHAQSWADDLASRNAFQHSSNRNGEGENLYIIGEDGDYSCRNAIKAFYSEEKYYDYSAPHYTPKAGHFTQLVWIRSTEIGVAQAETAQGNIILVFRYKPGGNQFNDFAENVKPIIYIYRQ